MSASLSINPAEALCVGFTLQAVRLAGEPCQCTAMVLEIPGQDLVVRAETEVGWEPGERVLFIAHLPQGRFMGNSIVMALENDRVRFAIEDRWDALDVRNHPRYPVSLPVRITPPEARKVNGIMADVSLGGARVALTEPVSAETFLLEVDDAGFGAWLPCRVVGTQETDGRKVLHLEFINLSAPQFAFVRNLVSHAREMAGGPRSSRLAA